MLVCFLQFLTAKKQKQVKAKGLGDSVANFTKKTGINAAVQAVSRAIGKPCGCGKRQQVLNEKFPYKN